MIAHQFAIVFEGEAKGRQMLDIAHPHLDDEFLPDRDHLVGSGRFNNRPRLRSRLRRRSLRFLGRDLRCLLGGTQRDEKQGR